MAEHDPLRALTKVWLAMSGEYSDLRVLAVCSSEENAKAIAALDRAGWHEEQPRELNQYIDKAAQGLKPYRVDINANDETRVYQCDIASADDGSEGCWEPYSGDYWEAYWDNGTLRKRKVKQEGQSCVGDEWRYWCYVWARDEQHAIKIASDKRAVYLATKAQPHVG